MRFVKEVIADGLGLSDMPPHLARNDQNSSERDPAKGSCFRQAALVARFAIFLIRFSDPIFRR